MLAILFGQPRLARVLLRWIFEHVPAGSSETLCDCLRRWEKQLEQSRSSSDHELARAAARIAVVLEAAHPDVSLDACARWVGKVSRYSLVTGQEWHTWTPGPAVCAHMQAEAVATGAYPTDAPHSGLSRVSTAAAAPIPVPAVPP